MPRMYPAAKAGTIESGHVLGDDFELSMDVFKHRSLEAVEVMIKRTAALLYGEILKTSPRDTSLFVSNHQIGINNDPEGVIYAERPEEGAKYDPEPPVQTALGNLGKYKLGDTITICNNLIYAIPLEFGHSKQAPLGVYRMALLKWKNFVAAAAGE